MYTVKIILVKRTSFVTVPGPMGLDIDPHYPVADVGDRWSAQGG